MTNHMLNYNFACTLRVDLGLGTFTRFPSKLLFLNIVQLKVSLKFKYILKTIEISLIFVRGNRG